MKKEKKTKKVSVAFLGGGCFWCTEAVFKLVRGVLSVTPGYCGGTTEKPTYDEVCLGTTDHAEVVKITFDPDVVRYTDLLTIFFAMHDPCSVNKQGTDQGTQYRSVIFYVGKAQEEDAIARRGEVQFTYGDKPVVTEIKPWKSFYPAEDVHCNYYEKNPEQAYCRRVIDPKLTMLKQTMVDLLKENIPERKG